jgi:LacI family transcriptional regulator
MRHRRTIVVVMDRSLTCHREILRGVSSFVRAHGDWHVHIFTPADDYLQLVRDAKPDGLILGWVHDAHNARATCDLVPHTIGVCGQLERLGLDDLAQVESDDEAVGELAAWHFLHKGFKHFAFVGLQTIWSRRRWTGFERVVRQAGYQAVLKDDDQGATTTYWGWVKPGQSTNLIEWLNNLPRPLAVLACHDPRGHDVIEACRDAELRVPDDVAILGVDNDDLDCELTYPPLSSVSIPWKRVGSEGAARLCRMMEGETIPAGPHFIPPIGIIERLSTDTLAISDQAISAALHFIREHAQERIGVDDVLRAVPVSRRSLEVSFRKHLGRSLLDEIRRVRLEQAKQLLAGSDMALASIAERTGFGNAARFSKVFHDSTGTPPSEYRRRFRS